MILTRTISFTFCFLLFIAYIPGEEDCQETMEIAIKGDFREGVASGPMVIEIPVVRGETCVRSVELYIDGTLVGVDPAPPFRFQYDFGDDISAHHIRARAISFDREVFETEIVTRDYDIKEKIQVQLISLPLFVMMQKPEEAVKDMFQLKINEGEVALDSLETDKQPLTVGILLDTSRSTEKTLETVITGIKRFLDAPVLYDAHVLTMCFHASPKLACDPTKDKTKVKASLDNLLAAGPTSLYDGMYFAVGKMKGLPGRKVLVAFSDGRDKTSRRKKGEVETLVKTSGVTVFHIIFGLSRFQVMQRNFWKNISEYNGGTVFNLKDTKKLGEALDHVEACLNGRYVMSFYPPTILPPGWHEMKSKIDKNFKGYIPTGFYMP